MSGRSHAAGRSGRAGHFGQLLRFEEREVRVYPGTPHLLLAQLLETGDCLCPPGAGRERRRWRLSLTARGGNSPAVRPVALQTHRRVLVSGI